MLRDAARFLLDLLRARIRFDRIVVGARRARDFVQRAAALATDHVRKAVAVAVGQLHRFEKPDVELQEEGIGLPDERVQPPFQRWPVARELDVAAARQPDDGDPIGRIQRIDEVSGRPQRRTALEPANMRLVHRNHDEAAGVGVFIRREIAGREWRLACRRRPCGDELGGRNRAALAVDFDLKILGPQPGDRAAVAPQNDCIDGHQIDRRSKDDVLRRHGAGSDEQRTKEQSRANGHGNALTSRAVKSI